MLVKVGWGGKGKWGKGGHVYSSRMDDSDNNIGKQIKIVIVINKSQVTKILKTVHQKPLKKN